MTVRAPSTSRLDPDRPLIVGGGHSGLLLALLLECHGLRPLLIDAEPPERVLDASFDGRALALMQGSRQILKTAGLWPELRRIATPGLGVRVKDAGGARIAYDAAELGPEPFGYGIETRLLRRRLLELVMARPGITLRAPCRLEALEREGGGIRAVLDDGGSLAASLVIGADGRGSRVRGLAGIGVERTDYHQAALTFALRLRAPHEHLVREFMRPAGPLALLPIGDHLASVTWIEPSAAADRLLALDDASVLSILTEQTEGLVEPTALLGRKTLYPLCGQVAARLVAPRIALVGDAAHGLHPIHAQGWNLGVRDIAALAEVLVDGHRARLDLGGGEVLQRYQRWRESDARLTFGLTDGLNRLFSTDLLPAALLRQAGLTILDQIAPLKHVAMRRGMGLTGDLPKLARGVAL
jgi:2-octaprenyl-6-methoxyphenol hydroxylase